MENDWAAEHLQVIRTLMERSAVYRRALAPIMLFLGSLGLLAAVLGTALELGRMLAFGLYWSGVAVLAVIGAFLLARRQAFKEAEPFWSPPTRRVAQALLPPLASGLCLGLALSLAAGEKFIPLFVALCVFFYGCALHAAGFFMLRGMRLFGWLLIALACVLSVGFSVFRPEVGPRTGHGVMGFFFGALQLAYGVYLWATERGKQAA